MIVGPDGRYKERVAWTGFNSQLNGNYYDSQHLDTVLSV